MEDPRSDERRKLLKYCRATCSNPNIILESVCKGHAILLVSSIKHLNYKSIIIIIFLFKVGSLHG